MVGKYYNTSVRTLSKKLSNKGSQRAHKKTTNCIRRLVNICVTNLLIISNVTFLHMVYLLN